MTDPDEQRMWELLKEESENEAGRMVPISMHAVQKIGGLHKKRAKDITKHWDNRGLVLSTSNGTRAILTQKGSKVSDPSEVS